MAWARASTTPATARQRDEHLGVAYDSSAALVHASSLFGLSPTHAANISGEASTGRRESRLHLRGA